MYTPYYPFRGVEFLCLCISTLMVLHRLLQHTLDQNRHTHAAAPDIDRSRYTSGARETKAALIGGLATVSTRTMDIFKFVSFIIVSFGVVGIICGLADAVFYNAMKQHLEAAAAAANVTSGKSTETSKKFKMYMEASAEFQEDSRSSQHFCEVRPPPFPHLPTPRHLIVLVLMLCPLLFSLTHAHAHRSSPSTSSSSCSSSSAAAGVRLFPMM